MSNAFFQVHPTDNVIVSLKDLQKDQRIQFKEEHIPLSRDVPSGHKIAIRDIAVGEDIVKYGFPIGKASKPIQKGDWVHTDNVVTKLSGTLDYQYQHKSQPFRVRESADTFDGYWRKNGEAGIRNEIWIINTVGCINKTAEILAKMGNESFQEEGIDGIYHFPHPLGCSQLGDDLHNTQKILGRLVEHPNAAAVLVLGLGCENNFIESFKQVLSEIDEERVKFLAVQDVEDELEEGLDLLGSLVSYAKTFKKEPIPLSKLKVGLKCGGSDGFSGITANPMVGAFSDMLISAGGTTILTEVPEMFGAETILMERVTDKKVFNDLVDVVNGFKEYFLKYNQPVYENPSPGNKKGGITTLEEKSLGCVQKGGFAPVVDVLPYGSKVTKQGLNIVQGPGNDLVSVTNLTAAGAHIVLFTTGRGTPFGGPVPTVKISTNTALFEKKKNWIDYNAGRLIQGNSMDDVKEDFFAYLLQVASGETKTKNEQYGFKEIAIFKDGVTL
ncbi:altronate dehydratase family protein [Alkalihalobacillus clausii]|uniref:UxaA family hydrolase n=1 Tax=Shouchella clausii TaxID=79880 RepID=UPI00203B726E|nr:altronate dehydratase family protein [Shouchella clausii]MCM3550745.1 altronate dehydratase family protein [Shouchella clausii]